MNLETYNRLKRPPATSLKKIEGGRLKGMSDINPQWRYEKLTEEFGLCGKGWTFEIVKMWTENVTDGQIFVFVQINLFLKKEKEWGLPIPGLGGSALIAKEKAGLYSSDEAYKMALTDAIGTAAKMIGVAADIYAGKWDGSKYKDDPDKFITEAQKDEIMNLFMDSILSGDKPAYENFLKFLKIDKLENLSSKDFAKAIDAIKKSISAREKKAKDSEVPEGYPE